MPLQQALRHLNTAFGNFFTKRAGYPRFKSRKRSRPSAEYTRSAFKYRNQRLSLVKIPGVPDVVWSRPLPEIRTWMCAECGVVHDRDVNAACNVLAAGRAER